MQKQSPGIAQILVMTVFSLSCIALALYLWVAFGGPTPFTAHDYEVKVKFREASQLVPGANVRISGIDVGRVGSVEETGNVALTVIEMDAKYAPLPRDTRAMLRQKTLLGETYVELTPGSHAAPKIPEGGAIKASNVQDNVQFDQVLNMLDPTTRAALRVFLQSAGASVKNRGADLNAAFGFLSPFVGNAEALFTVLNEENAALEQLVSDGAVTFAALSEPGERLASLVRNLDAVLTATAGESRAFADAFNELPGFLRESEAAVSRLATFATSSNDTVTALKPVARSLVPMLGAARETSPDLERTITALGPLFDAGERGLPALGETLDEARPLLAQQLPFLRSLNPLLQWVGRYKNELNASVANLAAASGGSRVNTVSSGRGRNLAYLKALLLINPEAFAAYGARLPTNRTNPYREAGQIDGLDTGAMPVFSNRNCTGGGLPTLSPLTPAGQAANINTYVLGSGPVAPGCTLQPNIEFQGQSLRYPHVQAEGR